MKNLLVTGGAGFIGSNFVRYMLAARKDIKIVNLDALTYAGSLDNLQDLSNESNHMFIEGNINDQDLVISLLRDHRIDTIVHFAAESHVDRSIQAPSIFLETNATGTLSLLEAARSVWLDEKTVPTDHVRFHHISTDEVYGSLGPDDPPFTEETPYAPNSPYAASKAASDHLVRAYAHTYGLPVTISNCSNNYGPYQYPEKLIPLTILNATEGKPLPIYGDGNQVRDWLFVEDHCKAIELILDKGATGETYNIGGDVQPTNLEVVEQICTILDDLLSYSSYRPHRSLIDFVPDRPGHDRRYAMDNSKIRVTLGWQPAHTFDQGLEHTVAWYLDNMAWVKKIQKKENYQAWVTSHYGEQGQRA